jgi:hypothetical protein
MRGVGPARRLLRVEPVAVVGLALSGDAQVGDDRVMILLGHATLAMSHR